MAANQIIYGTGVMPAPGAVADQLTATTRRGMIPIAVDQYSKSTPLLAMLTANANVASGGVSSITQPAKFNSAVAVQSSDFSGRFNLPADKPAISNAVWNLKLAVIPIQMYGVEMAIQDEHAIVNLMESRYDDVGTSHGDYDSTALFGNTSDTSQILGLPAAIDDGTGVVNYAGISRTTQPAWKSYYRSVVTGTYPTRANTLQYIMGVAKNAGGEMPKCVFVGMSTWLSLQQDYQGQEVYNRYPGAAAAAQDSADSGFIALNVGGIPVFADPYCAEGDMWIVNHKYLNLYLHERLGYAMAPFESMLANGQYAYISAIFSMRELVCAKPAAQGHITNFSYVS